jgi:predicted nucleic acid-binding protein
MIADPQWAAPTHAALETIRTIRRFQTVGTINAETEALAVASVIDATVEYCGAEPWLLRDAWALRHNLSIYDAPYVAIAIRFSAPLLTADQRLARAAHSAGATVQALPKTV